MEPDEVSQLLEMRSNVANVIGFYELLYEHQSESTPLQRMTREVHFATSAHALACDVHRLISAAIERRS